MSAPTVTDRSSCEAARHGDVNAYRRGCRCEDARDDRRLYMKRGREGRLPPGMVSSVGAARRLQALSALGWSATEIAERMGSSKTNVLQIRSGRRETMTRSVATRVEAVYEQLSGTPGGSDKVRNHAARAGWAVPLRWDDDAIDNPHAKPVEDAPVRSPRVDLGEVEHLRCGGMSLPEIAQRLGVHPGSIERAEYRAQQRGDRTAEGLASYWAAVAAGEPPATEDEHPAVHERDWARDTTDEQEWVDA
jgi:hypothetical protein